MISREYRQRRFKHNRPPPLSQRALLVLEQCRLVPVCAMSGADIGFGNKQNATWFVVVMMMVRFPWRQIEKACCDQALAILSLNLLHFHRKVRHMPDSGNIGIRV